METTIPIGVSRADIEAMGLGHVDQLVVDLEEVTIAESVEIERRLGLSPGQLIAASVANSALAMWALTWLALRQLGEARDWSEVVVHPYVRDPAPVGKDDSSSPSGDANPQT